MRWMLFAAALLASTYAQSQEPWNPFAGTYAIGGFGGGFSVPRSYQISSGPPGFFTSGTVEPIGWSGFGAIGYNGNWGPLVIGLEISARGGPEKASDTKHVSRTATGFTVEGDHTFTFENRGGVHVSGRAGLTFFDALFFAKAGVGASNFRQTAQAVAVGLLCDRILVTATGEVCIGSVIPVNSNFSFNQEAWRPSFLLGLGLEKNFGRWFARAGVDAEGVLAIAGWGQSAQNINAFSSSNSSELLWSVRGSAGLGFRF